MDVDTVSGATYSSRGILNAILDALGPDYLSTTAVVDSVSGATSIGSGTTRTGSTTGVDSVSGATSVSNGGSGGSSGGGSQTVSTEYEYEDKEDDD